MRAALLYDESCNFCLFVVGLLNVFSIGRHGRSVSFVPLQKSYNLAKRLKLTKSDLNANIHLVESDRVFKGNIAIAELGRHFPYIAIFLSLFRTNLGARLYKWVSKNRYIIFGCSKYCASEYK